MISCVSAATLSTVSRLSPFLSTMIWKLAAEFKMWCKRDNVKSIQFLHFAFSFSECSSKISTICFNSFQFCERKMYKNLSFLKSSLLDLRHIGLDEKPKNGGMVTMLWGLLAYERAATRRERWLGRFCWSIRRGLVLFTAIAVQTHWFEMRDQPIYWKLVINVLVKQKSERVVNV